MLAGRPVLLDWHWTGPASVMPVGRPVPLPTPCHAVVDLFQSPVSVTRSEPPREMVPSGATSPRRHGTGVLPTVMPRNSGRAYHDAAISGARLCARCEAGCMPTGPFNGPVQSPAQSPARWLRRAVTRRGLARRLNECRVRTRRNKTGAACIACGEGRMRAPLGLMFQQGSGK